VTISCAAGFKARNIISDKVKMRSGPVNSGLAPKQWRRVIFFRSARMGKITKILSGNFFHGFHPDEILVIAQEGVSHDELKCVFGYCEVFYVKAGIFSFSKISFKLLKKIISFKADAFVIPYNGSDQKGYALIEFLGLLSRSHNIVGIDENNHLTCISLKDVLQTENIKRAIDRFFEFILPFMHKFPWIFVRLFPKRMYPKHPLVALNVRCNFGCFFCCTPSAPDPGQEMKFENLYKLKNVFKYAETVNISGYAEVFLYPRLEEALRYIFSQNPNDNLIQITTNGSALTARFARLLRDHLRSMVISLNAANPESYKAYMNYDMGKTLARVREFLSAIGEENHRKFELHFVTHKGNLGELDDFVRLAASLGVTTVVFHHLQVRLEDHAHLSLMHVKEKYNAAVDQATLVGNEAGVTIRARKFFSEKEELFNPDNCRSPFNEVRIGHDGRIRACCYFGAYSIGNAFDTSFEDVWFGEAYRKLRKKRYLEVCQRCVPFRPFDDYRVHFHSLFKETEPFKSMENGLKVRQLQ